MKTMNNMDEKIKDLKQDILDAKKHVMDCQEAEADSVRDMRQAKAKLAGLEYELQKELEDKNKEF